MKIVLAVDGSKYSLNAVRNLIRHADWYRANPKVELVFVNPPVPQLPGMNKVVGKKQVEKYYREEGEAALAEARKLLDDAHIAHTDHILVGPIAPSIVELATSRKSDLIAIGSHGRTEAGNILMGSVATRVLHISPLPVLLTK